MLDKVVTFEDFDVSVGTTRIWQSKVCKGAEIVTLTINDRNGKSVTAKLFPCDVVSLCGLLCQKQTQCTNKNLKGGTK